MKTRSLLCSFALLALSAGAFAADTGSKPNIIVILADDYGWGSAACFGAPGLKTPNLDRLAREGRRFTHAYAPGSVCSPTRYALMTGRYYWRTSVWKLVERVGAPKFEHRNAKTAEQAAKKAKAAGAGRDELHNLKDDPAETKDVAADNVALVAKMKQMLAAARDRGFTRAGAKPGS